MKARCGLPGIGRAWLMASLASAALGAGCAGRLERDQAMQQAGWRKLVEAPINNRRDVDVVAIPAGAGPFATLVLKAENGAVELYDVVLVLDDGEKFSPKFRLFFKEGTTSREIDLPRERRRFISRVELRYGKHNDRDPRDAVVELWAR